MSPGPGCAPPSESNCSSVEIDQAHATILRGAWIRNVGQLRRAAADRGYPLRPHAEHSEIALHFVGALLGKTLVVGGATSGIGVALDQELAGPQLGRSKRGGEILGDRLRCSPA